MLLNAPDLTKQPPRSPRVRLGGYAILPRMLDKGRALLAGQAGEYNFACPLDQQFLQFAGLDPKALKTELQTGKGDGEILDWISAQSKTQPTAAAIAAWSAFQDQRGPGDPGVRTYFNEIHAKIAPKRVDITSWFELLDLDDYVSFGGRA